MERIRHVGRPVALVALAAVLLAVAAWFGGSTPRQDRAYADWDWQNTYWVTCADMYLDVPPEQPKGEPPGPEDILTGKALTRAEPSQTKPGGVDLTSVIYLGPDVNQDGSPVPDRPPSEECLSKLNSSQFEPENFRLDSLLNYQMVSNTRPTATAQLVPKGPDMNLEYATCSVDESTGKWSATQVEIVLSQKGPKGVNYGTGWLFPEADSPQVPHRELHAGRHHGPSGAADERHGHHDG
jgi:hypothetical protein